MKKVSFAESNVDSCLYMNKNTKGRVYVVLYIDNNLMIGNTDAIDEAIEQVKQNWLVLKVLESLQYYPSYEIWFSKDKRNSG